MMFILYDVKVNTINYHISKIFEDAELPLIINHMMIRFITGCR